MRIIVRRRVRSAAPKQASFAVRLALILYGGTLAFLALAPLFMAVVRASVAYTAITASSVGIKDSGGNALQSGRITLAPVDTNGNPLSATGIMARPTTCLVVAGAITTQVNGNTCQVADALAANPTICYKATLLDTVLNQTIPTPGQNCLQPTGSTWAYDTYTPSNAAIALQVAGPPGPPCSVVSGSCTMTVPFAFNGGSGGTSALTTLANLGALAANGTTSTGSGTANVVAHPGVATAAVSMCSPLMGQAGRFIVDCFPGTEGSFTQFTNAVNQAAAWCTAGNNTNAILAFGNNAAGYNWSGDLTFPTNANHCTFSMEGVSSGDGGVDLTFAHQSHGTVIHQTGTPTYATLYHPDNTNGQDNFFIRGITVDGGYAAPCALWGGTINTTFRDVSYQHCKGTSTTNYAAVSYATPSSSTHSVQMNIDNVLIAGDSNYGETKAVVSCPGGNWTSGTTCTVTSGGTYPAGGNNSNGLTGYVFTRYQGVLSPPPLAVTLTTSLSGGNYTVTGMTENTTATVSVPAEVIVELTPNAKYAAYYPASITDSLHLVDEKVSGIFYAGFLEEGGNFHTGCHVWDGEMIGIIEKTFGHWTDCEIDAAQRLGVDVGTGSTASKADFKNMAFIYPAQPDPWYTDWQVEYSSTIVSINTDSCGGLTTPSGMYYSHISSSTYWGTLDGTNNPSLYPASWELHGLTNCKNSATTEPEHSPNTDFAASYWTPNPGYNSANVFSFTQNEEILTAWEIVDRPVIANQVCVRVVGTDSTSNDYSISFYNAAGSLVLSTGAVTGTSHFGSATLACIPLSTAATIPAGRYYVSFTTNCASSCATLAMNSSNFYIPLLNATGSTTSGGTPNSTITVPSDSWGSGSSAVNFELHK